MQKISEIWLIIFGDWWRSADRAVPTRERERESEWESKTDFKVMEDE